MSFSKPIRPRGVFILLEGLDRSGKTSQCEWLEQWLNQNQSHSQEQEQGHDQDDQEHSQQKQEKEGEKAAIRLRFPDRTTPTGKLIDSYLQQKMESDSKVMQLLFSANRWEKQKLMRDTLEQGTHIVVDRYSYSGLAYAGSHPHFDLSWSQQLEKGLLAPDVVLFLNVDAQVQQQRGQFGQERYETNETQQKVRQMFEQLRSQGKTYTCTDSTSAAPSSFSASSKDKDTYVMGTQVPWCLIDANRSMNEVSQEIQQIALQVIQKVQHQPLSFF